MSAGARGSRAPDVEPALDLVAAARRPLVWAGGGAVAAGASDAVGAVAERLGAPVVTTYSAAGIAAGHPLHVGLPPHVPEIGAVWDEADLVIAVGSDLDGMMTQNWRMPPPQRLVAINVDEADAAKNWAPDVIVGGDARDACEALAGELSGAREPWVDVGALKARTRERLHGDFPAEMRFLDAFAARAAAGGGRPVRHVHPRLLARRVPRRGRAAAADVPARAGGRSAVRSRSRSARRSRAAGRSCRSRATADSCSRAASSRRSPRSACR